MGGYGGKNSGRLIIRDQNREWIILNQSKSKRPKIIRPNRTSLVSEKIKHYARLLYQYFNC